MAQRSLDRNLLGTNEDWYGNNAAINCPVCSKLYIVSSFLNKGSRKCPNPRCGQSSIHITKDKVTIEWAAET